jgi:hypothetical protein
MPWAPHRRTAYNDTIVGSLRALSSGEYATASGPVAFWLSTTPEELAAIKDAYDDFAADVLTSVFSMTYDDGTVVSPCVLGDGVEFAPELIGGNLVRVELSEVVCYVQ